MTIRFLTLPIALPIILAAFAGPAAAIDGHAAHGQTHLAATLNGGNEVNAEGARNQGDPDGTGSFSARLTGDQLCYTLTSTGIDAPTMAHIHTGAAGVNGGVFVAFTELTAGEHCVAVEAAKAAALTAKPDDYYVNVHNAAFPGGAIRGQLAKHGH